ncbi:hypothetical protein F4860DRAFT_447694 [Xylaria cubensis]|nr:hypothetical protein F4860DRAFT_447694 [Xylaria cubensis]
MDPKWQEAPEVAEHSYPEVYHPVYTPSTPSQYHSDVSAIQRSLPPVPSPKATQRRIFGCSILIFSLSIIIALLSIAVIGLAVGTGVEARRANNSESKLASLMSNITMSMSNYTSIDRGCSTNPNGVTGSTYTSQFFSRPTFKIYCDANAPNNPIQSLFVGTFDDCIDACAFYSNYTTANFPNVTSTTNTTCVGVSYIPEWTNRTTAMSINAPGNCYLKPGPQTAAALTAPQGGGIVHAAILSQSDK